MLIRAAKFISFIFHPLFMPVYGLYLIFNYNTYLAYAIPPQAQKLIYTIVIINTFIFPALTAFILYKRGWIQSLEMETLGERLAPFLSTAAFYAVACYLLWQFPLPRIFKMLFLGTTVAVGFTVLINIRWKISIHMVGIGGIAGAMLGLAQRLMADFQLPMEVVLLCAGLVGSARLAVQAHTPAQIYAGFFAGMIIQFLFLSF